MYKINLDELLKVSTIKSVKDFGLANIVSIKDGPQKSLRIVNHDISKY